MSKKEGPFSQYLNKQKPDSGVFAQYVKHNKEYLLKELKDRVKSIKPVVKVKVQEELIEADEGKQKVKEEEV